MKTKIFVTFSLVLSFGLTFERSIETKSEKSQTSDQNSEEVSTDDAWNPLAELLGLKVPESREDQTGLSDLFQKHSMEMDRAMNDHQNMMDKAMQEHQGFLQSPLGDFDQQINQHKSAMDGHQKMMDTEMNHHFKDMSDFDKDWEQFDKDMSQMFKEFDSHMSQMSAPFEQPSEQLQPQKEEPPIAGTDEKLSDAWPKKVELMVKQKAQNETEKTGLPVFHPDKTDTEPIDQSSDPPTYQYYDQTSDQLPVFISNLLDSFKPVLSDLQKDAEERISTSQANTENKQQSETLTIEEGSESNDNSTEVDLLSQFVDSIANSATALGSLIFDGLNYDGNNTMIVTEDNGDGTHDVKLIPCQCPKAEFGQHMKDCPMLRMPMQMLRESPQNAKVNSTQDKIVKEWKEAMAKAEEEEERMSEADEDLKMKLKIAFSMS